MTVVVYMRLMFCLYVSVTFLCVLICVYMSSVVLVTCEVTDQECSV